MNVSGLLAERRQSLGEYVEDWIQNELPDSYDRDSDDVVLSSWIEVIENFKVSLCTQ